MPFSAAEIGPTYDLGLATRDGSALSVRNADGKLVNVSAVAFMTTSTPDRMQTEETELQRKEHLVQLGSTNAIDREFDQWPQITQGDWSGGMYQRILTEQNRYWDGTGVLWRTDDWVPSQPLVPAPVVPGGGAITAAAFGGTAAGYLNGAGMGYAYFYQAAGVLTLAFASGSTGTTTYTLANPVPAAQTLIDFTMGGGAIWFTALNGAAGLGLYYVVLTAGALVATKLADIATDTTVSRPGMAFGTVGNQVYVATIARYARASSINQDRIRLFNVTGTAAFAANSFLDLNLPMGTTINQIVFLGDSLYVSVTAGADSSIVSYSISSQQWSTQATLTGMGSASMVAIGGGLFVLGRTSITATLNTIDMFLLQGGALQYIAPLDAFDGTSQYAFATAISRLAAFGPYAVWSVATTTLSNQISLIVFAYDVLRGRLFKVASVTSLGTTYPAGFDNAPLAVFSAMQRALPAALNCDWGIALNITGMGGTANAAIQEVLVGVNPSGTLPILQPATQITSSLIDFTSSQNKLFRQLVANFSALGTNAAASVKLDAWLDQDPNALAAVPDYTVTVAGGAGNAALKQLSLPINQLARKIVYRVTTTGGIYTGGVWVAAPKLISVVIQAATGWVQNLNLDLAPGARTNGQNAGQNCFANQGIDAVTAYNFLKQLWRQKGGYVTATFPNLDAGNWAIQMVRSESPKAFAVSVRSDMKTQYQSIVVLKLREDV